MPGVLRKNKNALIEYTRNYYANNRQTILAKAKAYNAKEENKQRRKEYSKQYWIKNEQRLKAQQKQYRNNKKPQINAS